MSTRVSGHWLIAEGTPHNDQGRRIGVPYWSVGGEGRARCSCGKLSPVFGSGAQRRKWHNQHKAEFTPTGDTPDV